MLTFEAENQRRKVILSGKIHPDESIAKNNMMNKMFL